MNNENVIEKMKNLKYFKKVESTEILNNIKIVKE